MGIHIGVYDVKYVEGQAYDNTHVPIPACGPLSVDKSIGANALKFIVFKSRQSSFIGIPKPVVIIGVLKIKIDTRANSGVNNRNFPVFLIVGLPKARKYRRIECCS